MKRLGLSSILIILMTLASVGAASAAAGGEHPQMEPRQQTYGCARYHIVRYGEALPGIAFDHGIPLQALMDFNQIYNVEAIYPGQKLCLPPVRNKFRIEPGFFHYNYDHDYKYDHGYDPVLAPYAPPEPPVIYRPINSPSPDSPRIIYMHIVSEGETVAEIAALYGVDVAALLEANDLSEADTITPDQRLIIPGYQPPAEPAPESDTSEQSSQTVEELIEEIEVIIPPAGDQTAAPEAESETAEVVVIEPPAAAPDIPDLPRADDAMVVSMVGETLWVEEDVYSQPDYDGITTLMVTTDGMFGIPVQVRSEEFAVDGASDRTFLGEFGPHRFVVRYLPPGEYAVSIDDPEFPSETVMVDVGPGERVEVVFDKGVGFVEQEYASPDGWVLASWENPSKPGENIGGWSNILVQTPGMGLPVKIESEGGGYEATCVTGSRGPGACDFAGLNAGNYWFWIDGTDFKVKTYMDGNASARFVFAQQPE